MVPIYNEEENILPLYQKIQGELGRLEKPYEILFVNDGSTYASVNLLGKLHKNDPSIRVIKVRRNYVQSAAMVAGFEHAKGNIIIRMDGDLQNDPPDTTRLLEKIGEGYDVVCGERRKTAG